MSPEAIVTLILSVGKLGIEGAIEVSNAIHAGDVKTTERLAAVLPDEHAQQLANEALIISQRAKAGL